VRDEAPFRALVDQRTNSVVISGPAVKVVAALSYLSKLDALPVPTAPLPDAVIPDRQFREFSTPSLPAPLTPSDPATPPTPPADAVPGQGPGTRGRPVEGMEKTTLDGKRRAGENSDLC